MQAVEQNIDLSCCFISIRCANLKSVGMRRLDDELAAGGKTNHWDMVSFRKRNVLSGRRGALEESAEKNFAFEAAIETSDGTVIDVVMIVAADELNLAAVNSARLVDVIEVRLPTMDNSQASDFL